MVAKSPDTADQVVFYLSISEVYSVYGMIKLHATIPKLYSLIYTDANICCELFAPVFAE